MGEREEEDEEGGMDYRSVMCGGKPTRSYMGFESTGIPYPFEYGKPARGGIENGRFYGTEL